ncbi:MAG: aminomethyl-transferring glycine dehydrogenase subunit GcvPB [Planctomycetota bacterium]|nr:aminomethyl-transferring glycine dehydrogenase subunit GcvPB [Planctomycetota bacterium]MDA1113569.1 aminomethyl-transferring glycine dehydrogenase subunit GcvPB [Planctomycetota bacterium]
MRLTPVNLLFEDSRPGRRTVRTPGADRSLATAGLPREELREKPVAWPEMGELDLVRHFTRLSQRNYAISTNFYPLGSCTMKYNPLVNEAIAGQGAWSGLHPLQDDSSVQGALKVMHDLAADLGEATGLPGVTLHPAAGAHGELTALMVLRAWLDEQGEDKRRTILIPDSAHGTNPASCTLAGFKVVSVKSDDMGLTDMDDLRTHLGDHVAGMMITNPNTLGLFEDNIAEICELIHQTGGKVYMDGANFNAIMGIARPGDFGIDMMHLNLHKTMSTPHGGGGPGSGPICVTEELTKYLPTPAVVKTNGKYRLRTPEASIGRVRAFHGNFMVLLRAYSYVKRLGAIGIRRVAENAVLNANYLRVKVRDHWRVPHDRICMHEFVARPTMEMREAGIHTMDVAKRLMELGYHPPTVYFPLVINEAIMAEPTETESRETLDGFAEAMIQVAKEAIAGEEFLHAAPRNMPVTRVDEAKAVKNPNLRYQHEA